MSETRDLLLEIGVEELPASFVEVALGALPELVGKRLAALRLAHGKVTALGTPRRLAFVVERVATAQSDLDEEVLGPPVSAAFDKSGAPTRAAEAFAKKLGLDVAALKPVDTPKGKYLAGLRAETGRPAADLLGDALAAICAEIPFRKSMRWGTGDATFGRPVRWLGALFGDEVIPFSFAGLASDRTSYGHRFLSPGPVPIGRPADYEDALRRAHVLVSPASRRAAMVDALHAAAEAAGGVLIEDAFLEDENLSLVEEPYVVTGSFEERFLELPDEVILEVARGHQRYFGIRGPDGRLLPRYLAVVNTALAPAKIVKGNDTVMRARLSDARFFFDEDRKVGLSGRAPKLAGIVFHNRLGTVAAKVERVAKLTRALGERLGLDDATIAHAARGALLAKCDLATLMVGEFPELQGVMGRAYALAQNEPSEVADVVRDHYAPKGAHDAPAKSVAAALVAVADRLDSLVGCFAVGLSPTGAADPYGLRRACLGVLRTMLEHGWDLPVGDLVAMAYAGFEGTTLDLGADATEAKLADFFRERLRGVLEAELPADVVDAVLPVTAGRPLDARARGRALATLDPDTRAKVGEVFKRVAQIAKDAPPGEPQPPKNLETAPHASEATLFDAYLLLGPALHGAAAASSYADAFGHIAAFSPALAEYFVHVFVMADDVALRENRLRTLRAVRDACLTLARFDLLRPAAA